MKKLILLGAVSLYTLNSFAVMPGDGDHTMETYALSYNSQVPTKPYLDHHTDPYVL